MNALRHEIQWVAIATTVGILLLAFRWEAFGQDAAKAKDVATLLRQSIARDEQCIQFEVKGQSLELVRIPPGEFLMDAAEAGIRHGGKSEGPLQRIKITKPFYLGRYEITESQFRVVMGEPAEEAKNGIPAFLLWYRIFEFNRRLSDVVGVRVELPTMAMWEYACRAGSTTRYYSGDSEQDLARVAWYKGNSGGIPHPVGQKGPNAWGLYDMHGNAWELCADRLLYAQPPHVDPVGHLIDPKPMNTSQGDLVAILNQLDLVCLRGGTYLHEATACGAALLCHRVDKFHAAGFRICIEPHRLNKGPEHDRANPQEHPKPTDYFQDPFRD